MKFGKRGKFFGFKKQNGKFGLKKIKDLIALMSVRKKN